MENTIGPANVGETRVAEREALRCSKKMNDPAYAGENRVAESEVLRYSSFGPWSRWAKNEEDHRMYQNLKKL